MVNVIIFGSVQADSTVITFGHGQDLKSCSIREEVNGTKNPIKIYFNLVDRVQEEKVLKISRFHKTLSTVYYIMF